MECPHLGHDPFPNLPGQEIRLSHKIGNKSGRWGVIKDLRSVHLFQGPIVQNPYPVGHRKSHLLVMGDQNGAHARILKDSFHLTPHLSSHVRIQITKGLIEKNHERAPCQGSGEGYSLLLSPGELMRIALGHCAHSHHLQDLHGLLLSFTFTPYLNTERCILQKGQMREQGVVLEDHTDLSGLWRNPNLPTCHGHAIQQNHTLIRDFETGNQAQGCGLSRPTRS